MKRGRFTGALSLLLAVALLLPAGAVAHAADADVERTETVYVTADASGTVKSVLSSVYLVNPDGRASLVDASTLTGIKNVAGNEAPVEQDGAWAFQADGDDVCYQGTAGTELPVEMRVTYELDGQTLTPAQIAGKSGHVRVTVDYTNKLLCDTDVNGETVPLYTPFTVMTIIALDEDFRHVTCEDAKTMSEAGSVTIIGTTFPGLAHNLDTDATGKLAGGFSFEADVKSFSLESIMAVVLPDIVSAEDLSETDDLSDFVDGVNDLNDAGEKLKKGARSLHSGTKKIWEGMQSYVGGVSKLGGIADQLNAGAAAIDLSPLTGAASSAGGKIGDASDSLDAAGRKIGTASGALAGLTGLTPEQQTVVDGALGSLSGAGSDLASAGGDLAAAGTALSGLSGGAPDLSGLKSGIAGIASGLRELEANGGALASSLESLKGGAWRLYKGLSEFCSDGLQELVDETEGISVSVDRKDAMLALSEVYTAYSAKDVTNGSVKFVITTDSIYVPKVEKQEPDATGSEAGEETPAADAPGGAKDATAGEVFSRVGEFFSSLYETMRDGIAGWFR